MLQCNCESNYCFHQVDAGLPEENDHTYYQKAVGKPGEGGSDANKGVLDGSPKDAEYATIDFSVLNRKTPGNGSKTQESIETEYAEIVKKVKEGRKENGKVEGKMTRGKKEEIVEDEELKQTYSEEERGDNTEVYSNVKDMMNSI